jgi:hypothetical protein
MIGRDKLGLEALGAEVIAIDLVFAAARGIAEL